MCHRSALFCILLVLLVDYVARASTGNSTHIGTGQELHFTHLPHTFTLNKYILSLFYTEPSNNHPRPIRNAFSHRFNSSDSYVLQTKEATIRNTTKYANRPPFAVQRDTELRFNPNEYMCREEQNTECRNKTQLFRGIVTREFRRMMDLFEEKYAEDVKGSLNGYNVSYESHEKRNRSICLSHLKVRTLRRRDLTGDAEAEQNLRALLTKRKLFPSDHSSFNSCAVISSAGSLFKSKLGAFIDSHDLVMRFNHAPIEGFEEDVGTKTTIRIINSQVMSKTEFDFLNNPLFRNITIAAWDPGRYNASLSDWIQNPDFDMFTNFKQFMTEQPDANAHLIDPRSLWRLWESLQSYFPGKQIRQNPPSSGFVGIALLVPHCETIDVIEYIPSTRLTGRCHYYEEQHNPMCTFGSWHPLAAEKLMVLDYNSADDFSTFQLGVVRIKPKSFKC